MKKIAFETLLLFFVCSTILMQPVMAQTGVGTKAPKKSIVLFDGSRKMLDEKWIYWEGPRFASALPIQWKIVDDPVDKDGKMKDPYKVQTDVVLPWR